jgi:hypothetical protein
VCDPWYLGSGEAVIRIDKYNTGSGSYTLEYRTAATAAACLVAAWDLYGTSFTSLGWVQIRITNVV